MSKRFNFEDGLTVFGFLLLVGACYLLFYYVFKMNYFLWYLENGANISWSMALFALVWGDLNKFPSLISSHPAEYAGSYARLLSKFFLMQAVIAVAKPRSDPPIISNYTFDSWLTLILDTLLGILVLLWVVVIAPVQYFVFIICGAPARQIMCSQQTIEGSETNWFSEALSKKPFSVTAAYTGMALWTLNMFLNNG